jgi:hypothetical protein
MNDMSTVEQAETTVTQLSADGLRRFRAWFEQYDADRWDQEFEQDSQSGKLDALADRAIQDFEAGRCREL